MEKVKSIQKENKLNEVFRNGGPSYAGAYHNYSIKTVAGDLLLEVQLQHGGRNEEDSTPGVLDVDLLEIVRDRYKTFVDGDIADSYTSVALLHVESALHLMNQRVEDRVERGVLGKNEK